MQVSSPEIWKDLQLNGIDLYAAEENATFWLWAYPSLLGWNYRFEWLFSPVVGNSKYPGDLWGIDEAGKLLLIEVKRGKGCDPFEDFIGYEKEKCWEDPIRKEKLTKKWETLYKSEQSFWQDHKTKIWDRCLDEITARGVVPYSCKRWSTIKWSTLYAQAIAPRLFEQEGYPKDVRNLLSTSTRFMNSSICYFGLIFVEDPCLATLSARGKKSFLELKALTANDRVNLMFLTAHASLSEQCVYLQCGDSLPSAPDSC